MKMLSICIITNNDYDFLNRLLNSIEEKISYLEKEIVVVDLGSEDKTKELAGEYTENIYDFMEEDYEEARSFAVSKCNTDKILFLEPDEMICGINEEALDAFLKDENTEIGFINVINHNIVDKMNLSYSIQEKRLVNRKNFNYDDFNKGMIITSNKEGEVQKELIFEVDKLNYFFEKNANKRKEKIDKKFKMIKELINSDSQQPYYYFLMAMALKMEGDKEGAREYILKVLEYPIDTNQGYIQLMIVVYGNILLDLELYEEALLLEELYEHFDCIADFLCLMGQVYLRTGHVAEALREFAKATHTLSYIVKGSNDLVPNYNMACIYEMLGEIDIAQKLYQRCGNYKKAKERLEVINQMN